MSNCAIKISDLTKNFRQFDSTFWSAVDALGISTPKNKYKNFVALNNINLEINAGEKVALIGRNGAGKSTLLRHICGQYSPDKGKVVVKGEIQALMELGTGFHSDFTGIENIKAAMSYRGIYGNDLKKIIKDVEEFGELEDFMFRPVREYSAGMYSRLAFAIATAVKPEILIVDEILGAGDAYFVGKCIQRMKELTKDGATVLFVSHDISSVQMLCDRGIWIDRGQVVKDGSLLPVSKAYLSSVRQDEENRLRSRTMKLNKKVMENSNISDETCLFRFLSTNDSPPTSPMELKSIKKGVDNKIKDTFSPIVSDGSSCSIIFDNSLNWKQKLNNNEEHSWLFGNYGGEYLHAPFTVNWTKKDLASGAWLELEYVPSGSDDIKLDMYDQNYGDYRTLQVIKKSDDQNSCIIKIDVPNSSLEDKASCELKSLQQNSDDQYGSGEIKITDFYFVNSEGMKSHTLESGKRAVVVIDFKTNKTVFNPVFVVALYRPDGTCAMQLLSNRNGRGVGNINHGVGSFEFTMDPLLLGAGEFIASVAVFHELDLYSKIEPKSYDLHDRCYALKVYAPENITVDLGMINQPISWEVSFER